MAGLSHQEIALDKLSRGLITEAQFRLLEAKLFPPPPPPPLADPFAGVPSVPVQIPGWKLPLIGGPDPLPVALQPKPADPFAVDPGKATADDLAAMFAHFTPNPNPKA